MSNKIINKAVLIGDYLDAPYHPLKGIDNEIIDIFKENFFIKCTENYSILSFETLKEYKLCILYVECWDKPVDEKLMEDLTAFVQQGGGLLVIHNGISFHGSETFKKLIGARFTGHPEYTNLPVKKVCQHIILEDINEFDIQDEPYRFEFDDSVQKTVLMEYYHEGEKYPAGWIREVGLGRIVYLMPGHDISAFKNSAYRKLIFNSGRWVSNL